MLRIDSREQGEEIVMISYLEGKIISRGKNSFVILIACGVGYEVKVAPDLLLQHSVGDSIKIFTYLQVREDAQDLYGISSGEELAFFKTLVSVSGVGPKSALYILALGSLAEIKSAIVHGDLTYLTKVSGIGRKIAERIVVELKDKLEKTDGAAGGRDSSKLGDVVEALVEMGYSLNQARDAVKAIKTDGDASKVLKEALKVLNKK
ncbi:MAG TPA: Holliday junction branch migration protein RuvA [Candidatus Magasanikbacteria bacterium]|nr:Holliday junction branch migration protein RuvA [Candidatus Magasanikbacteria bacterium]